MKKVKKQKLITVDLVSLIGKNVEGVTAQIRNPIFLGRSPDMIEEWRVLKRIRNYKENGRWWVCLDWIRQGGNDCGFTGCTVESNTVKIQFTEEEFRKVK